ncbi:hypothetical protein [Methylomonas sp. DH-1]|nr:hypothetical protein [Methylomonas sp. DH-1]
MSEALAITQLLETSNQLSAFCTQNGWIISDSIDYENPEGVRIFV